MKETMISAYAVILLVFGLVLSYLGVIHRFWLRDVFREDHKPAVRTRIVILGGGFGGLYSALHFEKTIAADPTVEVTLVSRENFVLFTPMLHEVAAGDLDLSDIVCPLRQAVASQSPSALRSSPHAKQTAILEL
jgi:hypothetical protein